MGRSPGVGCRQGGLGRGKYLQLPLEGAGVAGVPERSLQGVGDHVAHAGLWGLVHLRCLDLQQQGAAHGGRYQLGIDEEEHPEGKGGGGGLVRMTAGNGAPEWAPSEPRSPQVFCFSRNSLEFESLGGGW